MSDNTAKQSILIVDDTLANLQLLVEMLNDLGYKVQPAKSGKMALKAVETAPPDLILLDVNMPEMDGYEVCRRLKANEKTSEIPVIYLSAMYETKDKVKAFEAGGVDYITKPFEIKEVQARITTHLNISQQKRQLVEQKLLLTEQKQQIEKNYGSLKELERNLQIRNDELEAAINRIKRLEGVIPICAYCKKIREEDRSWQQLEQYISEHSEALFSHGICPECLKKHFPEMLLTK